MRKSIFILILLSLLISINIFSQDEKSSSDFTQIEATLMDYIEGTANGQPERLQKAFHPDFNLYSVNQNDSLRIWKGQDYIAGIKVGQKNSRIGRIISIDFEKDVATAKAEILIPGWRAFIDYFLLVKYQGAWKIIHKSYTSRSVESKKEK